ncbi:uncharacterized protein CTRU02_204841 [Colletotrichum truncatum]|uniref:Uncharacterized protein n=1 Tax=Colletotrichum truncatum TaxID=5467 RepID=A0ACC3ZDT2_COLTU|nr:uncharacterized protein CTRU02_03076 [Colletotrichum truncatum]KAF6798034.1 hypothetical protein CTRU02_03076 [Colletotrichum truncatum]
MDPADNLPRPSASETYGSNNFPVASDTYVASDFVLFNHFITSTSLCLSLRSQNEAIFPWKTALPTLAPMYPYLLHEVLAVAAIHLHHLHPDDPANYLRIACDHQAKALRQFRDALSPQHAEHQAHALFACSALMSNYYFAAFDDPASLLFNQDPSGPPAWILPIRGCSTLVRQLKNRMFDNSSWTALIGSLSSWSDTAPSHEMLESDREIQSLESRLDELSPCEGQLSLYNEDFQLLKRCFRISKKAEDGSSKIAAMIFAATVSDEFLHDMSERKRPEALAIMAFWCVLLSRLDPKCWLRNESVPQTILSVIESHLSADYLECIQWAVRQIRSSSTKVT